MYERAAGLRTGGALSRWLCVVMAMVSVVIAACDTQNGGPQQRTNPKDLPALDSLEPTKRWSEHPAFAGASFADELQADQDRFTDSHLVTDPVGDWGVSDFSSADTNVEDGERRTLAQPNCSGCERRTVWLMGGSAAFGLCQRDEHTIASELVRLAAVDGISLTVRNFGVPAITIYQEDQKLRARLESEPQGPDLVLFYDGFNDVAATLLTSSVHGIDPEAPAKADFNDVQVLFEKKIQPTDVGTPEELGKLAALKYRRVLRSTREHLASKGIASLFVYQPDSLTSAFQYEEAQPEWPLPPAFKDFTDEAMDVASEDLEGDVVNLRHFFDESEDPMFVDLMHQPEPGARKVAEAIYPRLLEKLG